MASVNKVILMGNVTREPELRYTPSGVAVIDIGLALNKRVGDGKGGYTEKVCYMDVSFWDKQEETVGKFVHKGDLFYCEGELEQTERIINAGKENERKERKTKVRGSQFQLLPQREPRGDRADEPRRPRTDGPTSRPTPPPGEEDEIPF